MQRTMLARLIAVGASVVVGCCVSGGASPAPSEGLGTTTLASVSGRIGAFAQDGPRLAWIRLGEPCGRRVEVFDIRTQRRIEIEQAHGASCTDQGLESAIAIGGARVVWEAATEVGNVDLGLRVVTAATNDESNRNVGELHVSGAEDEWPPPLLAGGGPALVFYSGCNSGGLCHGLWSDVRGIVGRRAHRLFNVTLPPALMASDVAVVADLYPHVLALTEAGTEIGLLEDLHPCPCNFGPQWSPDGKKIAWSREGTVYVMNVDGSGKRRVSPAGEERSWTGSPRWSPDGSRLAYEFRRETFGAPRAEYLVKADGSWGRRLTSGGEPRWSPSGQKLSFVRDGDIWAINTDGSGIQRLTNDRRGAPTGAPWSPDGTTLAAALGDTSLAGGDLKNVCSEGLYAIRADGSGEARIARAKACHPAAPQWSPRGDRIAFSDGGRVVVVNADGSARVALADGTDPVWSPDGTRLAFSRGRLFIVASTGGTATPITPTDTPAVRPSWSPDGRTIVFGDSDPREDHDRFRAGIFSVAPDGTGLKRLAPDEQTAVELRDARTGARVASFLTPDGAYAIALSPAYLALLVRTSGPANELRVYRAPSSALVASTSVPANTNDYLPSLAVSSTGIAAYRVGRSIRAFDPNTGATLTITTAGSLPVGLSIDGHRLAWAENRHGRALVEAVVLPARLSTP
jgi:Tol biopolymer transport system component